MDRCLWHDWSSLIYKEDLAIEKAWNWPIEDARNSNEESEAEESEQFQFEQVLSEKVGTDESRFSEEHFKSFKMFEVCSAFVIKRPPSYIFNNLNSNENAFIVSNLAGWWFGEIAVWRQD